MWIKRLRIKGFRGIKELEWLPSAGINCLVGPGDSGKSTCLSAIALLLAQTPPGPLSEFDYYNRSVDDGFEIEAVLADVDDDAVTSLRVPVWRGWKEGEVVSLPEDGENSEKFIVASVRGTEDLEVEHHLHPPSGEPLPFPARVRQRMMHSRVTGADVAGRELRLGRGSLLERQVGGAEVRAEVRAMIARLSEGLQLPEEAQARLDTLRERFGDSGLPNDISLGLITPGGNAMNSFVGLMEGNDPTTGIPLAHAGAGTRQMVLFQMAAAMTEGAPVITLDEPEVGLEPYRQLKLMKQLRTLVGEKGQAFLTSHSPTVLKVLEPYEVWRYSGGPGLISMATSGVNRVFAANPVAMLSRLPTICEGITEVGLLEGFIDRRSERFGTPDLDSSGVALVDGGGQGQAVDFAQALVDAGIECSAFVDAESEGSGKREALSQSPLCELGTWPGDGVRNIEEALAALLPWDSLVEVVRLAAELQDRREESLLQEIGQILERPGKTPLDELKSQLGEAAVRDGIAVALGTKRWFKSRPRAVGLGRFLAELELPAQIEDAIGGFWLLLQARLANDDA